jgi:hypothetical protein
MNAAIDVKHLLPVWEQFHAATDIGPIRDEAHYARMTEILEALLDETQGDEKPPAMGLVDIVGDLIEDYEAEHHPVPEATGVQALNSPGARPQRTVRCFEGAKDCLPHPFEGIGSLSPSRKTSRAFGHGASREG